MAENVLSPTGSNMLLVDPSSPTGHNHHNSVPYHGIETPAQTFSEDVPLLGDRTGEDEVSSCGRGERQKSDALVDYEFRWGVTGEGHRWVTTGEWSQVRDHRYGITGGGSQVRVTGDGHRWGIIGEGSQVMEMCCEEVHLTDFSAKSVYILKLLLIGKKKHPIC